MSLPAACAWSLATALLLAGCTHREPEAAAPPVAIPIAAQPVTIETLQLAAAAFAPDRVQVRVYLPPGYAAATQRYRVLYVNDGQDMDAVQLQPTLARLYARDAIGPVIVVAIHMLPDRMGSYGLSDRAAGRSPPASTRYGTVGARARVFAMGGERTRARHRRALPHPHVARRARRARLVAGRIERIQPGLAIP